MHGDRFIAGSRTVERYFLGHRARFPLGPFTIISKLQVPYSFAFAVRGRHKVYHLSAEPFIKEDDPERILDRFIIKLEDIVRNNPYQWFNFYNFWASDIQGAKIEENDK